MTNNSIVTYDKDVMSFIWYSIIFFLFATKLSTVISAIFISIILLWWTGTLKSIHDYFNDETIYLHESKKTNSYIILKGEFNV